MLKYYRNYSTATEFKLLCSEPTAAEYMSKEHG